MPQPSPRVAVIVLNWNGADETIPCLRSLDRPGIDGVRVIVVDNGSAPEDAARVAAEVETRARAELLRNQENLGFTGGCNAGIARARELGAEYVFLLNNDARVDPATLPVLVEYADAHPRAGLVAPLVLDETGERIWAAGGTRACREVVCRLGLSGQPVSRAPAEPFASYALTGCALLVRSQVFDDIGAFDPLYFAYVEDVDFSVRARLAGWEVTVVPAGRVLHRVSAASGGGYNPLRGYLLGRGTAIFVRQRADLSQKLGFAIAAPAGLAAAAARELLRGRMATVAAKARGYLDGLRLRPVDTRRFRA